MINFVFEKLVPLSQLPIAILYYTIRHFVSIRKFSISVVYNSSSITPCVAVITYFGASMSYTYGTVAC